MPFANIANANVGILNLGDHLLIAGIAIVQTNTHIRFCGRLQLTIGIKLRTFDPIPQTLEGDLQGFINGQSKGGDGTQIHTQHHGDHKRVLTVQLAGHIIGLIIELFRCL